MHSEQAPGPCRVVLSNARSLVFRDTRPPPVFFKARFPWRVMKKTASNENLFSSGLLRFCGRQNRKINFVANIHRLFNVCSGKHYWNNIYDMMQYFLKQEKNCPKILCIRLNTPKGGGRSASNLTSLFHEQVSSLMTNKHRDF